VSTRKRVILVGSCGSLPGDGEAWPATVEVRRAATATEGLLLHREESADVIAVDLDLPDGPAEQFCEFVRAEATLRRVSLMVLCGPDEIARRRAADCRANAHVVRPKDARALSEEVLRQLAVPQRAKYRVLAQVTVENNDQAYSFFCTSENVSATGILVETEEALRLGQTLDCSLFLPGRLKVATRGRVVREASAPSGRQFGIQFVDLPHYEAEALGSFIQGWGRAR
jgi:DNA-binding NarL/FixJ family response regulator